MVTVFTPTYNRAYIIEKLYLSLQKQTSMNFEWLVVDDGSTDDTEKVFSGWINEKKFPIRYIRQENGGKHRAINRGVIESKGDLFFIVDSDDYLATNAIEIISSYYDEIKDREDFGGVCGLKCYPDGKKVGGGDDFGILDCNSIDFRYKYKVKGDMAEVIRTDVMKEYPIPEIDGEKFCPELVFFNRIAQKYKLRYFYKKIYICDYLPDGLTAKITKIRMQSPQSSMICYSEMIQCDIPFLQKMKAAINYWRFSYCLKGKRKHHNINTLWRLVQPAGYILHRIDTYKQRI